MPSRFPFQSRGMVLRILPLLLSYLYGTITLFRIPFQETSSQKASIKGSPPHYISIILLLRIQFELDRFRSLLLTASQLIFFPAGTKTLQFPAFPDHDWSLWRSLIRTSLVQSLRSARQGISLLVTSFIGVSNRVIHLAAYKDYLPAYLWLINMKFVILSPCRQKLTFLKTFTRSSPCRNSRNISPH